MGTSRLSTYDFGNVRNFAVANPIRGARVEGEMKPCRVCKQPKPPIDFADDIRKAGGKATICRTCAARKKQVYNAARKRERELIAGREI